MLFKELTMIYVKNCVSVIPGYNNGKNYGDLVSTKSILENMQDPSDSTFDCSFVAERLGIKSVARSHFTLNMMKNALNDKRSSKRQYSLCYEHETLKEMLIDAMNR